MSTQSRLLHSVLVIGGSKGSQYGHDLSSVYMEPQSSHLSQKTLFQGSHKPGKSGILTEFSERGKLVEFSGNPVQPRGKIIAIKIILVRSNICVNNCCRGK